MKTQYRTATSLDGCAATEDDSPEWPLPHGDAEATDHRARCACRHCGAP